jgi:hypothetical protein
MNTQFMIIALLLQNRHHGGSIGIGEARMYPMLNNTRLRIAFWDKAITTDLYLKIRTNNELIIDGKISS